MTSFREPTISHATVPMTVAACEFVLVTAAAMVILAVVATVGAEALRLALAAVTLALYLAACLYTYAVLFERGNRTPEATDD